LGKESDEKNEENFDEDLVELGPYDLKDEIFY